ncbi:MAG: acetyl-CoA carboxylase biotin carboxyl carrier protein subunit [Pseudonocardiales bacterium]|nr:acyl-CoA carboxylase subunit epsilon [Actinomycetota bacterium]PZS23626.1 MAG: acetyl-CoA carboxylase biotin carboxyl carrier protein subunit [Pseudonocardiales bacterium]
MLRIVRGEPSDDELAALITVLAALPNAAVEPPAQRNAWADPAHRLRSTPTLGRCQWRHPR